MTILIAIIIGGLIGWFAAAIMGREEGLLGSIVIGVVGSIIGGVISSLVTGTNQALLGFSWIGLFWSLVGAIILVVLLNAFTGWRASHRSV